MRVLIVSALAFFAFASPSQAEWWEAETDHFIVYSESSEADAKKFAEQMEQLDMSLRSLQNVQFSPVTSDSQKLTVFRFGVVSDISRLQPGAAGFYIPRLGGSVSFTPVRSENMDTGALLFDRKKGQITAETDELHVKGDMTFEVNGKELPAKLDLKIEKTSTVK